MVGLFAFLVTHFLVLLGIFPGALVVVFSGTLEVRLAEGLVASSPGSQASGSLPRLGIQLQLKGSEMESRPGVPGDAGGGGGRGDSRHREVPGQAPPSPVSPCRRPPSSQALSLTTGGIRVFPMSQALCWAWGTPWPQRPHPASEHLRS